jgi:hypothetical protein
MEEKAIHLMADRKKSENRKGPGRDMPFKDMSPVTYLL